MSIKKFSAFVVLLGLLLPSVSFAATRVDANLQDPWPGNHIQADIQLDTRVAVSSGGTSVSPGGEVCSSAPITMIPSLSLANWGTALYDVQSTYPDCDGLNPAPCPAMISAGAHSGSHPVRWLSTTDFDRYAALFASIPSGIGYDGNGGLEVYRALGSFPTDSVTYVRTGGLRSPNMRAGVNIFCKGQLQVRDGTTVLASYDLSGSTLAPVTRTLADGSHTISTRLIGVDCIGAVVKHPINDDPASSYYFRIYYYSRNRPSFPSSDLGAASFTVNVNPATSTCDFRSGTITSSVSSVSRGTTLVRVPITNRGDQMRVTGVRSSMADYIAVPATPALCTFLGFPISPRGCPATNGFNVDIASGATSEVAVLVTARDTPLVLPAPTLIFTSRVTGGAGFACSSTAPPLTCERSVAIPVDDPTLPTACVITSSPVSPAPVEVGTGDIAHFKVYCTNAAGISVPCRTTDWSWGGGISGGFQIDPPGRTTMDAYAIPTSGSGALGTINYVSGSASCSLGVRIIDSEYACVFNPSSATLSVGGTQRFDISCRDLIASTPINPSSVGYGVLPSPLADTSDSSVTGTTVTGRTVGGGLLVGDARFATARRPWIVGHEAIAGLTVSAAGAMTACSITSVPATAAPVEVGNGDIAHFQVACTNSAGGAVPCVGNSWSWAGGISGRFQADPAGRTETDAYAIPTSAPGSLGNISYTSGTVSCSLNVRVVASNYTCDFTPPSASMIIGGTQRFDLHCRLTATGAPLTPDTVGYGVTPPTIATTGSSSVTGTTVTAIASGSALLQGDAHFPTTSPWIVGHEATAPIEVTDGSSTISSCLINPTSSSVGQDDFREFTVACYGRAGIAGPAVPCVGSDWSWAGISGFFDESTRSNSRIIGGPSSSPGASGQIQYRTGSVNCTGALTVLEPEFSCNFNPSSATLIVPQSQAFTLFCSRRGSPTRIIPDDVRYSRPGIDLVTSLTSSSVNGATVNALGPGTGSLLSFAYLPGAFPILGHRANAPITISGPCPVALTTCPGFTVQCVVCTENGTAPRCTGPGGAPTCGRDRPIPPDIPPGDSDFCSIGGGRFPLGAPPIEIIAGRDTTIGIYCGPSGTGACRAVNWGVITTSGGGIWQINDVNDAGRIILRVERNSIGRSTITARVNGFGPGEGCSRDVIFGPGGPCPTQS